MLQFGYPRDAPATAATGRAERWVDYSAIVERPPLRWPHGCRLALWICPNILHYEPMPPADPWLTAWPRMPAHDVLAYGRQAYGVRVGFWRMLDVLDKHSSRRTAVINSQALQLHPKILQAALAREWDFVGHGRCNTSFTFGLTRREELDYFRQMKREVEALTGKPLTGTGDPDRKSRRKTPWM